MKLAIHPDIKGKPDRVEREGKVPLYICNGVIVNQGYGWETVEVESWKDAFELITIDGYATSAALNSDHRTDENYVSRQICMVDIDDGMTIQELFNDDFYNEFGAGFYTTKRHTDEAHRFRILFVLEEPENDCVRMRKIIRGLLETYKSADTNCKDGSRIYYGIPNCPIKEYRENILPKVITDALVDMIDRIDLAEDEARQKKYEYQERDNVQYDEIFIDKLLSMIQLKTGTFKGQYDEWKTIAWATCHSIGMHNAEMLMMKYWPTKTKKELNTLRDWKSDRSPTVGTLIKLSGISKDSLRQLDLEFRARNNIQRDLTAQQAIRQLKKKTKIY